jgi:hypothetical protein
VFGINVHKNRFFDPPTERSVIWHAQRNDRDNTQREGREKIGKMWRDSSEKENIL